MAQIAADRRDVDFVLHEQLKVAELSRSERFAEFNRKTVDLIVSEARNLALKEMHPCMKEADEQGCTFTDGHVRVPEVFHRVWDLFREGEWVAMTDSPEWGGQGMPATVALAADNYFNGANYPFMLHVILTHGAGRLVEKFGTEKQKSLFLEKMYTGQWGGSMLLTEPDAGSDVGALTTRAVKNDDGTYDLTGSKIFITSGEHDLVENIIHPVLARIDGAPEGTGGISLFLVPKIWVNDDGTLGAPNDIVCTGIEDKMGIHASPTCAMSLGSRGRCRGTLLGQENKGMRAMFVMMNDARLMVGMQGFSCASASYLNALSYARERVQGRHLLSSGNTGPSVPIIQHPDIRRILLTMKTYSEGMRSLLFYIGLLEDLKTVAQDTGETGDAQRHQALIDVLIPVAKGYVTDRAFEMCSMGVQVFGGYGFTREYPQEQLLRDCKITQIYEGTNGIQAMDLLGRKLIMDGGAAFAALMGAVGQTVDTARERPALEEMAQGLADAVPCLTDTAKALAKNLTPEGLMTAFAHAHPFMDVTGDVVMAWMLLWRAVVADRALAGGARQKEIEFYTGQVTGARFFIRTVLPTAVAKMGVIRAGDDAVNRMSDAAFGGK